MSFLKTNRRQSGFTLVEILIAAAVFILLMAALLTSWGALQTSSVNTTAYAQRQNDQMRVVDYLKRDIRRATAIQIYNGTTLVTGTAAGTELRLTIPKYYADSREEDNAVGSRTANTPTLTNESVVYGTPLTVRYYVTGGAIIRNEASTERTIADAPGDFTLSFNTEASGEIRSKIYFNQPLRSTSNRKLRRDVTILSGQRAQLLP